MKEKIKILCAVVIMFSLFACNDLVEDSLPPLGCTTYIKFVSPSGENVLDSLNVIEKNENTPIEKIDTALISTSLIRESDNQPYPIQSYYFYASPKGSFPKNETLAKLQWIDHKFNSDGRPQKYNEIYSILLYGPKVFGDDETHTLKWYVDISGGQFNAYKCELDGREVSLDNDPFYNEWRLYDNGRHSVAGIITINCK